MPDWFVDRMDTFGREDAIVFEGLGNIWEPQGSQR